MTRFITYFMIFISISCFALPTSAQNNTRLNSEHFATIRMCGTEYRADRQSCSTSFKAADKSSWRKWRLAHKQYAACKVTAMITYIECIHHASNPIDDGGEEADNIALTFSAEYGGQFTSDTIGLQVTLNGETLPAIGEDDIVATFFTPGEYELIAIIPGAMAARQMITIPETGRLELDIVLSGESLSSLYNSTLTILGANSEGSIARDAPVSLVFADDQGSAFGISRLANVMVYRIEGGSYQNGIGQPVTGHPPLFMTDRFTIVGNTIQADTGIFDQIENTLGRGEYQFEIAVENDELGVTFEETVFFRIGQFDINGILERPTGANYNIVNRKIILTSADGTIVREAITDSSGEFIFDILPLGHYELFAQFQHNNGYVAASGVIRLRADSAVVISPLSLADRDAGLEEFTVETNSISPVQFKSATRLPFGNKISRPQGPLYKSAKTLSNSISVTASGRGQPVKKTTTFNLPIEETRLLLKYTVSTEEYPDFVLEQSEFDDEWSVRVIDDQGAIIFRSFSNVNAQLQSPHKPELRWNSNGSTDQVEEEAILSETPSPVSQRSVRLEISATNIGDNALPTSVTAQLESETISFSVASNGNYQSTAGNSVQQQYISLPNLGENNHYDVQMPFVLRTKGSSDSPVTLDDITRVKLTLKVGETEIEIFDQNGITGPVTRGTAAGQFIVQMAFVNPNGTSSLSSPPPIANKFTYTLLVEAEVDGLSASTTVETSAKKALWTGSLAATIRAGNNDEGGDDWATKITYDWITDNIALLGPAIGDISGHHGRNISHQTHKFGNDVDFRQYGNVYNGGGRAIYNAIRRDTFAAIDDNNAVALTNVQNYISAQRVNLEALRNHDAVNFIYGPVGQAGQTTGGTQVPRYWLDSLIQTGVINTRNANGETVTLLDIGGNLEGNATYGPLRGHDDHYHVRIQN